MKNIKIIFNKKLLPIAIAAILIIVLAIALAIILNHNNKSPNQLTKEYFNKFQKEDKSITSNIKYEFKDKLTAEQQSRYEAIIKKQYNNLKYVIEDSYIGKTDANIKITFTVKDLKSEYERADSYIASHQEEFKNKSGEFDTKKAINYKLENMENAKETIDYSITINFYKDESNKWIMINPQPTDVKKISGTF